MTAGPKKKSTEDEYLALERAADYKSDFYQGEIFAMAGATAPHNRVKENFVGELHPQLKGGPCFTMSSDMKVKIAATRHMTYPDVVVVCGEPQFLDNRTDVLLNPVVVIEVQSPSTERYDRGAKFRSYQQVPTLQEIVFAAQDEPLIDRYVRQPDGSWNFTSLTRLDDELAFAAVPARVHLRDLYAGLTSPAAAAE